MSITTEKSTEPMEDDLVREADSNEDKDQDEYKSAEDNTEDINKGTVEHEETPTQRRLGRPKIIRTGIAGRPRKVYAKKGDMKNDPTTVNEAMGRNDADQ